MRKAGSLQEGPRRDRFAAEYLVDLNATQAAIRAGYSKRSAYCLGSRLMKDPDIQAKIRRLQEARGKRVAFSADEVLAELGALVRSNVQHFTTNGEGELVLAEGAPADAFKAIASVKRKIRKDRVGDVESVHIDVEFRLYDKNSAIEKAMKHLGIAGSEKHELTGADGNPLVPAVIAIKLVRAK